MALFSFINYSVLRMPTTIGVMFIALVVSLGIVALGWIGVDIGQANDSRILSEVDFNQALLNGMLSFLLFAGAMQIKFKDLTRQKWAITVLSTAGVLASTFIVGALTWLVLGLLSIPASFIYCLLFGALISPTDPVAFIGILKTAEVPKTLHSMTPVCPGCSEIDFPGSCSNCHSGAGAGGDRQNPIDPAFQGMKNGDR